MIARIIYSLAVLICLTLNNSVFAQTYVPPAPGQDWTTGGTAQLSHFHNSDSQTTLVQEQAELCTDAVAQNIEASLWSGLYWYAPDYDGLYVHNCSDSTSVYGMNAFVFELSEFGAKVSAFLTARLPEPIVAEFLFRPSWFQLLVLRRTIVLMIVYLVLCELIYRRRSH